MQAVHVAGLFAVSLYISYAHARSYCWKLCWDALKRLPLCSPTSLFPQQAAHGATATSSIDRAGHVSSIRKLHDWRQLQA